MISTNFILSSVVDSVKGKVSFCLVSVWKKRYTFLWRKMTEMEILKWQDLERS